MSDRLPSDLAAIETPALVVDLDRLDANLGRAAEYAASHGLALRPHVKTHKSPYVAEAQLRLGAKGLTCATPREAEVMAEVSDDVLLAYPPVGRARARRIAGLPASLRVPTALDSEQAATELARAARDARREVGVYVELDLGMHRVGAPTVDAAVALARHVSESDGITFDGTLAAQKFLSCVYRIREKNGFATGVAHVIDVLRGRRTDKITQWGHDTLSTYGIGADHTAAAEGLTSGRSSVKTIWRGSRWSSRLASMRHPLGA